MKYNANVKIVCINGGYYMKKNNIECKVCGKEIEYNENGTCEECHKKITERLKNKGKRTQEVSVLGIVKNTLTIVTLLIAILSIF